MRLSWITTAALTLGVSSVVPTFAHADERHDDRGRQPQRVEVRNDRGHDDRHIEVRPTEVRHTEIRPEFRDVRVDRDVRFERDVRVDLRPRIEVRYDAGYTEVCPPDFDVNVNLSEVPGCVIDAERHEAGRNPIEAVQYVRRDGKLFYRFRVAGRYDTNYRFTPDGQLLSVEAAG